MRSRFLVHSPLIAIVSLRHIMCRCPHDSRFHTWCLLAPRKKFGCLHSNGYQLVESLAKEKMFSCFSLVLFRPLPQDPHIPIFLPGERAEEAKEGGRGENPTKHNSNPLSRKQGGPHWFFLSSLGPYALWRNILTNIFPPQGKKYSSKGNRLLGCRPFTRPTHRTTLPFLPAILLGFLPFHYLLYLPLSTPDNQMG